MLYHLHFVFDYWISILLFSPFVQTCTHTRIIHTYFQLRSNSIRSFDWIHLWYCVFIIVQHSSTERTHMSFTYWLSIVFYFDSKTAVINYDMISSAESRWSVVIENFVENFIYHSIEIIPNFIPVRKYQKITFKIAISSKWKEKKMSMFCLIWQQFFDIQQKYRHLFNENHKA